MPEQSKSQGQDSKGPESYLSADERKALQRSLSFPEDLPSKFKSWILDFVAVNIPQIPFGQIAGVPSFLQTQDQNLQILDRDRTAVTVDQTTTETSLYSLAIAGGAMSTNRSLRIAIGGDFQYAQTNVVTITIRVKLGGSTLLSWTSATSTTDATSGRPWVANALIINTSASTQAASLSGSAEFPSGTYAIQDAGTGAVDTAVDKTLEITLQKNNNAVFHAWNKTFVNVELV